MATILVVDDDKFFRQLATTALTARAHSVIEAGRCRDADQALASRAIDLVVIDGLLPDGEGSEWVQRLRLRDPRIPVLFVTGFRRDDERLRRLEISGILHKPLTGAALAAKVENA